MGLKWDLGWDLGFGIKMGFGNGMGFGIGMGLWQMGWDGMGFGMGFGTMGFGILPFPLIWAASIVITKYVYLISSFELNFTFI
jgi:hypothetical protein